DYKPLEANIPYIVSFPGERYYEFDLSSKFYKEKMNETWSKDDIQTITFSSDGTTIPVTGVMSTNVNGYVHVGTFLHKDDATYVINNNNEENGTEFNNGAHNVLPFRTYMTATSSSSKSIIIGSFGINNDNISSEEPEESEDQEDDLNGSHLQIYTVGSDIIVESTYPTTLRMHTISGGLVRILDVRPGTNTYNGFASGLYIVGRKKLQVR
ncbi:MAG: hypothetical protein KBT34_03750, partial [Prevotella sp.]|nr:hypothetical protein [Candidatus Prevotella equi]